MTAGRRLADALLAGDAPTATAAGRPIDGVLRVIDNRDITLMVRPLSALLPAVEEMKRRLAA